MNVGAENKAKNERNKKVYPEINLLFQAIEEELCLTVNEIESKSHECCITYARMIFTYLLRRENILTLVDIGLLIRRNYTTLEYYLSVYDDNYKYNKRFRLMADKVITKYEQLKNKNNGLV